MQKNTTKIEGDKLTITRIFDAPRERVWKLWTEPEEIKKWWGPGNFTAPSIKIDFRVGGRYIFCMHGPKGSEWDKDIYSTGVYKEIVPMEKIVATDYFSDQDGSMMSPSGVPNQHQNVHLMTVTFEDAGEGKTKLTLVRIGHSKAWIKMAAMGWEQSLDKFAVTLNQ